MRLPALPLALIAFFTCAAPADAQSLGTFRWRLGEFCSVLNLNVTQQGSIYLLNGFEAQCGGNPNLPAWGVAVPQPNGSVILGITTILDQGNGLHTRATINLTDFSGGWTDNANQSGLFIFNPGAITSGGPRINPLEPDQPATADAATPSVLDALKAELDALRQKLAELEAKKP